MTVESQKTFGKITGMEALVPTKRHGNDPVECSDGTTLLHRDVYYDVTGGAHSNEDDALDGNVTAVTDLLNKLEEWVCEYTRGESGNDDYADGYAYIIDEMAIEWKNTVDEWVREELGDCDELDDFDDLHDKVVEYVYDELEGSSDAESEFISSDYAAYSGKGCCLRQFSIDEIEEQVDINAWDVLKDLHEQGRLDDVLDHVNCNAYISRSRRREKNEKTGRYELVGRETYMPYDHYRKYPTFEFYTSPGGQWAFVVPADRMKELIREGIADYIGCEVADFDCEDNDES